MNYRQKLNSVGLEVPSVLLPRVSDLAKWPVIACDQYTQDREYWKKVKDTVSGSPSALNLIFPEVYLSDNGAPAKINDIHSEMECYLRGGVFSEPRSGFVYIERDTPYCRKRRGLIAAVDLEQYDWHPDARPLIRSTEGTVSERLPVRMEIRRGAVLELSHVLLLIDDNKDSLLPALGEKAKMKAPAYNTPLMMNSGHITGWFVDSESEFNFIADKLIELSLIRGADEGQPFLFAAGDGNHSLAAAKNIWREYKDRIGEDEMANASHPCRYALVEIENIYDPAVQFEPIHRLVFDIGYEDTVTLLSKLPDFSCRAVKSKQELSACVAEGSSVSESAQGNRFGVISDGRYALIETSASGISTACLQPLLDEYAKDNPGLTDYIHDEEELFRLSDGSAMLRKTAGIILPPVQKSGLFKTVARYGPLPRKSFSMGHSCEKRFYLEARRLF